MENQRPTKDHNILSGEMTLVFLPDNWYGCILVIGFIYLMVTLSFSLLTWLSGQQRQMSNNLNGPSR